MAGQQGETGEQPLGHVPPESLSQLSSSLSEVLVSVDPPVMSGLSTDLAVPMEIGTAEQTVRSTLLSVVLVFTGRVLVHRTPSQNVRRRATRQATVFEPPLRHQAGDESVAGELDSPRPVEPLIDPFSSLLQIEIEIRLQEVGPSIEKLGHLDATSRQRQMVNSMTRGDPGDPLIEMGIFREVGLEDFGGLESAQVQDFPGDRPIWFLLEIVTSGFGEVGHNQNQFAERDSNVLEEVFVHPGRWSPSLDQIRRTFLRLGNRVLPVRAKLATSVRGREEVRLDQI